MELLFNFETEKWTKQKYKQYNGTPAPLKSIVETTN